MSIENASPLGKAGVSAAMVQQVYRALLHREASTSDIKHHVSVSRSAQHFLEVVLESEEYARCSPDTAPIVESKVVNLWHPELSKWTHAPGTRSADGAAIVGLEGWLFLYGGSNQFVPQFAGELVMAANWLENWRSLVQERKNQISRSKRKAVFLVVPEKISVLIEHYPEKLTERGLRPVRRLIEEAGLPIIYPLAELRAAAKHHQVCLRTDSHFTLMGNYILYQALLQELDCGDEGRVFLPQGQDYIASGDLGRKFSPPIHEIMNSANSLGSASIAQDNREDILRFGGHIGTQRVFKNDEATDRRCAVIFGDSYAFGDTSYQGLSWFLAQTFREVHFVWAPFGWDPEYVDRVGADVVIMEMAERFAVRVPALQINVSQLLGEAASRNQFVEVDAIFTDSAVGK